MFIIIDNNCVPTTYDIDTPDGERRARIALAAAGFLSTPVWRGAPDSPEAYRTSVRLYADTGDDEVTAVYTPSPALLAAATRGVARE
jgi:hypothetical protein